MKNERWKPEVNDPYWITVFNDVAQSTWIADDADESRWQSGNCFKTREEATAAAEKVKALLLSLHGVQDTESNQPKKLTAEVFNRPDCPEWAKYAAVDEDGSAVFFDSTPRVSKYGEWWLRDGVKCCEFGSSYDASDWHNSMIERPTTLPDWCKVGAWCYCLDDDGNGKYFKITQIKDNFIYGDDWDIDYHFVQQARLRPYNADEMKALVGRCITLKDGAVCLCTAWSAQSNHIILDNASWTAEELFNAGYTIDGNSCGVLEHLNDKGEWVK